MCKVDTGSYSYRYPCTNTIAYYGCNDIVVDIFNFNIGTSVAGVILMYVCSYAFNFCIWHKLVITYNALIIAIVFIIRYCITECSYSYLLLSYYILAGIILLLILSIIADENGMIDADGILNDMIDNLIISPVKEERGIKIGAGTVEIKIPFINKAIALDKDDINEFKEMLSKIQQ